MLLNKVKHVDDYENAFLSHMRIDLREKMQIANVFIIANKNNKRNIKRCKEAVVISDPSGLCDVKETFDKIDFEIITNEELENNNLEYFIGKNICVVV